MVAGKNILVNDCLKTLLTMAVGNVQPEVSFDQIDSIVSAEVPQAVDDPKLRDKVPGCN